MAVQQIEKVGVVGAGTMGRGIAQAASLSGLRVVLYDAYEEALAAALRQIRQSTARGVERRRTTAERAERALTHLSTTRDLSVVGAADLVIEAVPEDPALKTELFAHLDAVARPETILASNTSSLSINALASATGRPDRFIGLHFFNPAHVMRLVEVIPADDTSAATLEAILDLVARLGKQAVQCRDTPAFIVNRVARPFYGEAFRMLGEGAATVSDIDRLVRSLGFPLGPFELVDLVGCDVNLAVTESVYRATYHDPRYRPHPLQRRMVESRRLGRKSGRGFYTYSADGE